MPGKKKIILYKWIKSFDLFDLLTCIKCLWLFFSGMSVCEWARLKVCSLVRTILRPQNPGREQGLTCRWQHGKRNSSRRFLCRSFFWKKKPLTFSLNILCIIHDSFLQLQLILIQDFSAGSYYFINTVFFQLQTIELYRYLAL